MITRRPKIFASIAVLCLIMVLLFLGSVQQAVAPPRILILSFYTGSAASLKNLTRLNKAAYAKQHGQGSSHLMRLDLGCIY